MLCSSRSHTDACVAVLCFCAAVVCCCVAAELTLVLRLRSAGRAPGVSARSLRGGGPQLCGLQLGGRASLSQQ